jgi:hypothetical protein
MTTEDFEEFRDDEQFPGPAPEKPFLNQGFVRFMAIMFLLGIYMIIYLKILFIK